MKDGGFLGVLEWPVGRTATQFFGLTTQLPLNHWKEVIPDEVIFDALIDRLEGLALEIKITGESYRKVLAKKLDESTKQK